MRHNIPITIRNVFNVAAPGTEIGRFPDLKPAGSHSAADFVKGFATIDNIALVNVEGYMAKPISYLLVDSVTIIYYTRIASE